MANGKMAMEILRLTIAKLGDLTDELTFIGGASISLHLTEGQFVKVRPTDDVDTVVEVANHLSYDQIREKLKTKGYSPRAGEKVICRFFNDELILDVMPDDQKLLGYTNRWFGPGMKARISFQIDGKTIYTFDAIHLVATKIEAFNGRGKSDFHASHDIEDLINLFDGRPSLGSEIAQSDSAAAIWIRQTLSKWLEKEDFPQIVEANISDRQNSAGRREIVLSRIRNAAN